MLWNVYFISSLHFLSNRILSIFQWNGTWCKHRWYICKGEFHSSWLRPPKKSPVFGLRMRCLRPTYRHFLFSCFCCETMSNCSQNCWIDLNDAMLCFKRLFHIGVWTFARFVRRLLATIIYVWEIWPPHIQCDCITYFPIGQKRKRLPKKKKKSTSLHRFWSWPMTRNQRLFFLA